MRQTPRRVATCASSPIVHRAVYSIGWDNLIAPAAGEEPMPKSKVRKKSDFTVRPVSRTPVKVKAGPSSVWFVAFFIGLMLIGLVWLLVFQLGATGGATGDVPSILTWMANLGPWNYAIAFAFMITGLLLTMRWR